MSRKYNNFRTQFGFVRVVSAEPITTSIPCACCGSSKHHQYNTEFRLLELRFDQYNQTLGDAVQKDICTKCLHYVFNQNLTMYHTNKRQQHYKKRFKDLHEWCVANTEACQALPTLRRFYELLTGGAQFKPELVEHVSRLIFHLRKHPILLEFVNMFSTKTETHIGYVDMNNLRYEIDRAEKRPNAEQLAAAQKFVAHYKNAGI